MGCDIHFAVDVRQPDGSWKSADTWDNEDDYQSNYDNAFYEGRNYDLFSIFADVRNGYGFAGVKTGEGFVPFAPPRGVPDDCSPEYRRWVEQWNGDGHSHSYFTVEEIMAYDWTQRTNKSGWVGPKDYLRCKLQGKPISWSGAISGNNIKHLSNLEMEKQIIENYGPLNWDTFHKLDDDFLNTSFYTEVSWSIPYYQAGREFLSITLPKLWRLGAPKDVRCLFFFDN